jgi:hypothetical protein
MLRVHIEASNAFLFLIENQRHMQAEGSFIASHARATSDKTMQRLATSGKTALVLTKIDENLTVFAQCCWWSSNLPTPSPWVSLKS